MEKKFLFVLAILSAVLLLVAVQCAPAPAPTPEVIKETVEVPVKETVEVVVTPTPLPPTPHPDKVTLKFLMMEDQAQINALLAILEEFQKIEGGKWSYVDIEFEAVPFRELFPKIEASVAAGLPWDLVQADGPDMKHYGFNRVILPLGEYFSEEEMKQWFPQSIEEGSFRGVLYGPPMMQSCSLMMYNTEMTDAAGVKPPEALEDSWTMEEALAAWQKTTLDLDGDGVPDQWGLRWGQGTWTGDYEHGIFHRSNGEKGSPTYAGMGEDGVTFVGYLDSDEAIEALQFYGDLHQKYKVTPVEAIPQIFETEKCAFMVTPDNRIGELIRLYGEDVFSWGVTGIPYFKTQICHTGSWHYGISPNTQHFEEALAYVRFAASDEGARIWYQHVRQLPANIALFNELPEYQAGGAQEMWIEAMDEIGIPRIQTPGYTEYQQMFAEAAMNIAQGADVAAQLHAAASRIEGLVAKYWGWNQ